MFSLSAEFPNDNPLLHRGVRWVCLEPTGAPIAEPPDPEPIVGAPEPEPAVEIEQEVTRFSAAVEGIARAVDDFLAAAQKAEMEPAQAPRSPIVALAPLMTTEPVTLEEAVETAPETEIVVAPIACEEPLTFEVEEEPKVEARPSGIVLKEERPAEVEADEEPDEIVVEELEPVTVVCVEGLGEPPPVEEEARVVENTELPPAPDDPFTMLVCTLADVAIASGSAHVASLLTPLLHEGQIDPASLPENAAPALREASIIDDAGVTDAFRATVSAWKALLRGTSDDFMACGGSMLDEWSSELLARLFGSLDRAPAMRRELRSRGVAAFGLAA